MDGGEGGRRKERKRREEVEEKRVVEVEVVVLCGALDILEWRSSTF